MSTASLPPVNPRPYELRGEIQHYAWGTRDSAAFIPDLLGIEPEPGLPYAELWIGAHPKAPSRAIVDGQPVPLDQWIACYPTQILGESVAAQFAGTLPFLFKVLSAGESLSIQSHPNKAQAEALHARDPEHYPDDNHKPEIAIALDALTALVGLKSPDDMRAALARYPEIAGFLGDAAVVKGDVRAIFSTLIARSVTHTGALALAIDALAARLSVTTADLTEAESLFLTLRQQYTGADAGLFALFLLNLVHLDKGQGIFTGPGIPHAYLKGNIVECMANSDNVVRVGLTPKFKDAATLLDILDYAPHPIDILGAAPGAGDVVYTTPAVEFQITRWQLHPGATRDEATGGRIEILVVVDGSIVVESASGDRTTFRRGQVVLIPASLVSFTVSAPDGADIFKAEVPDSDPCRA